MCLKMLCKCTIIWYYNASLCKKLRHYFRQYFFVFTVNSKLSFLSYYVNLSKGEVLVNLCVSTSINWGRMAHICVGNLTIIGSDSCLSPGRRHAIIWTEAGILLILPPETDFNEIIIKSIHFHSRQFIWKFRQEYGGHFVLAFMCEHSKAKWRIYTSLVYVIID